MTTKSKGRKAKDAQQVMETPVAANQSSPFTTKEPPMSDSILRFSQDVMDQEQPQPLPVGEYPATITATSTEIGKASGKRYVAVQFRVDADDYPSDYTDGNPDGTILTYNLTGIADDTPQARWKIKRFLSAIGAKGGATIDINDWLGLGATIEVTHEEWEGAPTARVARVKG